jgi:hypothetical protein
MLKHHHETKKAMRPVGESHAAKDTKTPCSDEASGENEGCRESNIRLVKATHHVSATQSIQIHELFKTGCRGFRDLLS